MTIDPAELRIVHYPADVLSRPAVPVERIDGTVRTVAQRMIELMHEAEGAGLAAPQVGLSWRMFVTRATEDDGADEVFINPTIEVDEQELVTREEGCLSLPGIYVDVRRPAAVTISAQDLSGDVRRRHSDDFPARVWQHEFDHLEGVLIIDRMTPMARLATRKTLKELRAAAASRS